MKKWIVIAVIASGLTACQPEGRVYSEHKELSPQIEWLREDVKEFNVPVEEPGQYNLSLSFRYATGYRHRVARVRVTEITPAGKENVSEYELQVRDEAGDYIGDPALDIWDSEHLVDPDKEYPEAGTYTYLIEHDMPNDPLNFAMEIGLMLDEAK